MRVQKLTTTDAFVAIDIDHAERAVGVTRVAPKILLDGATWLARSVTYAFASFELPVSGASAGVNAKGDARADAIAAYVAEVSPLTADGRFCTSAGKGVGVDELAVLASLDSRGLAPAAVPVLTSATVAAAVGWVQQQVTGGEVRAAVEGLESPGLDAAALIAAFATGGTRVVAAAMDGAGIGSPEGIDSTALAAAVAGGSLDAAAEAGVGAAVGLGDVLGAEAEVLVAGSKVGLIDHELAGKLVAGGALRAVVPCGPVAVTAKALAVLQRGGVTVVPDFLSTAGVVFGSWPADGTALEGALTRAGADVAAVLDEVAAADDGLFVAACRRAEAFLATWCEDRPFGRPLA